MEIGFLSLVMYFSCALNSQLLEGTELLLSWMITEQHAPVLVLLCRSCLYFPKVYSAKFMVKETTSPFSRIFFSSFVPFFSYWAPRCTALVAHISAWSGEKSHFINWLRAFSMVRSSNTHISHSAVGHFEI